MMRIRRFFSVVWLSIPLLTACSDQDLAEDSPVVPDSQEAGVVVSDQINIRLREEIVSQLSQTEKEITVPTGVSQLDDILRTAGARHISRVFPQAGKDEYKQRAEGLHLWYTVFFDKAHRQVSRAAETFDFSQIATVVEPVYIPQQEKMRVVEVNDKVRTRVGGDHFFNDPLYTRQWDFHNTGIIGNYTNEKGTEVVSSIAGADINVEAAWQQTTGDPAVVVAVVDGGIDYTHPDLQGSLWTNKGEIPDNGIDDDNNGYVDDYYGYNFVDDTPVILGTRHGTHVAGTIAARSNNGHGVCGIAGGNGETNTGVKVMSCQIFRNNPDYDPNDPESAEEVGTGSRNLDAAAIVYGANNGAVICQNSWGFDTGYKETPQVIREAIEYFNKYAGGDKTEKPLVKGGVVLFAAGNDGVSKPTYPAADENVISVGAFNPDFQASWYTNYGETVDISAPGGSQPEQGRYPYEDGLPTSAVLSTVPVQADGSGGYAYMQGTSMACPHVSGIAALIVSKYGGADFTAEELRQRIVTGVKPLVYNDYVMSYYFDGMGLGYADAAVALADYDSHVQPVAPEFLKSQCKGDYVSVKVAWQSANKGADGSLQYYQLYYSEQPITPENYQQAVPHRIQANSAEAGDVFERTNNRLKSNTTYYFAVQAVARNGKQSPVAILDGGITTLNNDAPVITSSLSGNRVTLAGKDQQEVRFTVTDKENHTWQYEFQKGGNIGVKREGNVLVVQIDADKYIPGIYPVQLLVQDEYGAQSSFLWYIEIVADKIPSLRTDAGALHVAKGGRKTVFLADLVDDEQPSSLTYTLTVDGKVAASIDNGLLTVLGKEWGEGSIEVSATDIHHQTGTFRLPVFVYENKGLYAVFPTVATTTLYVKVGDVVNGDVKLVIRNAAGKQALCRTFNTSSLDKDKRTYLLDVQSLSPGSYTLAISNQGNIYQQKFVKQ